MRISLFLGIFQRIITAHSDDRCKRFNGWFLLTQSQHKEYTHQNSAPILITPAQYVESTVHTQFEVSCEIQYSHVFFKEQLKHFSTIGAKDIRVDFDCRKYHFKNTLRQIAT